MRVVNWAAVRRNRLAFGAAVAISASLVPAATVSAVGIGEAQAAAVVHQTASAAAVGIGGGFASSGGDVAAIGIGPAEASAAAHQVGSATGTGVGGASAAAIVLQAGAAHAVGIGPTLAVASAHQVAEAAGTGIGPASSAATSDQVATAAGVGIGTASGQAQVEVHASAAAAGIGLARAFASEDVPAVWKPRWRIIITGWPEWPGGVLRASLVELHTDVDPFEGLLVEEPVITRRLTDPIFREVEASEASFSLKNADGALTAGYLADPVGLSVEIQRWDDEGPGYFLLSRFVGRLTWAGLDDGTVRVTAATVPLAALEELIPWDVITTDDWPKAVPDVVGKTLPVLFGTKTGVPLYCVCDDPEISRFLYLVPLDAGSGLVTTNATRRDGVGGQPFAGIHPEEFEVRAAGDFSSSFAAKYPNARVLRFFVRQTRHGSNELHNLFGDFSAPSAGRNPARAYRNVVTGAWALAETADATSFDDVEAHLTSVGGLLIDGVLGVDGPVQVQDVLRELALVRGLRPGLTSAGAWTLTADRPKTVPALALADGEDGPAERNAKITGPRQRPAEHDRIADLVLKGARDLQDGDFRAEAVRTVNADIGSDKIIECRLVEAPGTLDRIADYLAKRISDNEETVPVEVGQEGRSLVEGDLVTLTSPHQAYSAATLEARELTDRLGSVSLLLQGYSLAPYTYGAASLPPDPLTVQPVDYTRTAPDAATSLTVFSFGVGRNAAGQDIAFVVLQWTAPSINFSASIPLYRRTGDTDWTPLGPVYGTGTQRATVTSLITADFYDFGIRTVNEPGTLATEPSGSGNRILAYQVPVDTTGPSTPANFTSTASTGGAAIELKWTKATEIDYDETFVYANSSDTFTDLVATFIGRITGDRFTDFGVTQGTQRFYKIRHEDKSGNFSSLSVTRSSTPSGAASGTAPATPSAPTLSSEGTAKGSDGKTWAFIVVTVPAMPTGGALLQILVRVSSVSDWTVVGQQDVGGGTKRVDGLVPGLGYQFATQAFNNLAKPSAVSSTLSRTAPGDTTAPSDAGTPVIQGQRVLDATFAWTGSASATVRGYNWDLRTGANGTGSVVISGFAEGTAFTLVASAAGYGVQRHFRVQPVAFTPGLVGNFTASVAVTFVQVNTGDLANQSVTSAILADLAVINSKLAALAVANGNIINAAVDAAKLAAASVATANLQTGSVDGTKLQGSSVASVAVKMNHQTITQSVPAASVGTFNFSVTNTPFKLPLLFFSVDAGGVTAQMSAVLNPSGNAVVIVRAFNPGGSPENTTISVWWNDT